MMNETSEIVHGLAVTTVTRDSTKRAQSDDIFIFLHGGPGHAHANLNRSLQRNILHHLGGKALVFFDQRGAGSSFSLTYLLRPWKIETFVADTVIVSRWASARFASSKTVLIGHSWGTIPALLAAYRFPSLFKAYISISQVVEGAVGEKISYDYALERCLVERKQISYFLLRFFGPPPHHRFWVVPYLNFQRSLVMHMDKSPIGDEVRRLSIKESLKYLLGFIVSIWKLWPQCYAVNFPSSTNKLMVPTCFIAGQFDRITPQALIENFSEHLTVSTKKFVSIKGAGHRPHLSHADEFFAALSSFLKNLNQKLQDN